MSLKVEDAQRQLHEIKVAGVEEGVVGVITNHSWLDNPTFRGMRKSLMESFDQIFVVDLHGNLKKKEQAPDGSEDQNVFDIEQGVAISLFVKKKGLKRGVFRSDIWGSRLKKYQALAEGSIKALPWQGLKPTTPDFIFVHQDQALAKHYGSFWSIPKIFATVGNPAPGIVTTHDEFAISFTKHEAISKVGQLIATHTEEEARKLFRLCSQSQWNYDEAKRNLKSLRLDSIVTEVLYRPFDTRWTIWTSDVCVHRRERVMKHMVRDNVAIIVSRQFAAIGDHEFNGISIAQHPVDFNCFRRGGEYVFPLFLYDQEESKSRSSDDLFAPKNVATERSENIALDFRKWFKERYDCEIRGNELIGYIYAILHAPTYRRKFYPFLRTDFPRIPFPAKREEFHAISELGWALAQKHLFRNLAASKIGKYQGHGTNEVEKARYDEEGCAIFFNKTQSFAPVPVEIWDFRVGGYQVIERYLKSWKGRALSLDEIQNVENIIAVLAYTIEQMKEIDAVYCNSFGD